jgi:hypothetical protein
MKTLIFLVAALVAAASLASFAGAARADTCTKSCTTLSNLAAMRHEMLKAVAQNLRG